MEYEKDEHWEHEIFLGKDAQSIARRTQSHCPASSFSAAKSSLEAQEREHPEDAREKTGHQTCVLCPLDRIRKRKEKDRSDARPKRPDSATEELGEEKKDEGRVK